MQEKKKMTKRAKRKNETMPLFAPFVSHDVPRGAQTGVRVGFPASRRVKLSYCESATLTSAYGAQALSQFRLNGCFDPWFTSTGHQPMGFDQWSLFYNHYVVLGCTWNFSFVPYGGAAIDLCTVLAHYSDDSTIPSTVTNLVELGSQAAFVKNGQIAHSFEGHIDIARFFNRTGDIANDDALRAPVTADPTEQVFLNLCLFGESSLSSITGGYLLRLEYDVKFFEPKDLGSSLTYTPPRVEQPKGPTVPDGYVLLRKV